MTPEPLQPPVDVEALADEALLERLRMLWARMDRSQRRYLVEHGWDVYLGRLP